ncbi:MAG: dihydroorotase family protein [Thermofilaceae archaeon]
MEGGGVIVQGKGSQSSLDLLVAGKLYIGGELIEAAVGVEGGRVAWVGKPSLAPCAEKRIDAGEGVIVLPGMVDMHVHMRDLNESEKEDWFTGTLSALAGGVTFVADMPNNKPPARTAEVLLAKEAEASKKAVVDYGFYIGLPSSSHVLTHATDFGVVGLKLYPEDLMHENLISALQYAATLDLMVVVHAEDPLFLRATNALGEKSFTAHGRLRPPAAEASAIHLMAHLAQRLGFQLHFTHVSSAEGLKAALRAKLSVGATLDTAVHYLFLSEETATRLGGLAKVNPPLRSRNDVVALRRSLRSGLLDAVVTDHAPHTLEEKLSQDYDAVPPGFPGLELCLPLLLTLIAEGEAPLRALDLYSSRPADLLGVPKGKIEVGRDADLVFVNTKERWTIKGSNLKSKAKYTPFEGFEVRGRIEKVFVRGTLAFDGDELLVSKGFGKRYSSRRRGGALSFP